MRIVLLVDADRDAVGRVGDLCDGVDDQTVVLLAVVGGDDIQTVADVEQRGHVVLVSGLVVLREIVLAQLVGELLKLLAALFVERGRDGDGGVGVFDILAALEHLLHGLRRERRP